MTILQFAHLHNFPKDTIEKWKHWLQEYYFGYLPTSDELFSISWMFLFKKYASEVGPNFRAQFAHILERI